MSHEQNEVIFQLAMLAHWAWWYCWWFGNPAAPGMYKPYTHNESRWSTIYKSRKRFNNNRWKVEKFLFWTFALAVAPPPRMQSWPPGILHFYLWSQQTTFICHSYWEGGHTPTYATSVPLLWRFYGKKKISVSGGALPKLSAKWLPTCHSRFNV